MNKKLIFKQELIYRRYSQNSIQTYCSCLDIIIQKFGENPNLDELKKYFASLKSRSYHKQMVSTARHYFFFIYKIRLDLSDLPYPRKEQKLPEVFSIEEISDLINYPKNKKHQIIICLLYSGGLRISELINLRITDIDSQRMIINIRASKGNKDRQIMLDKKLLEMMREYFKEYRPKEYLINGQFKNQYTESSINQLLKYWAKKAGIKKHIHAHCLRHSFATHLLESGIDMSLIQKLLGHSNIKTTEIYAKISTKLISKINSPLSFVLK